MRQKVVIFGIDNFSKKNQLQLNVLIKNKFELDVFTNDSLKSSEKNLKGLGKFFLLEDGFLNRFRQVYRYLKTNPRLHHAEVYPGGRFSFVYILLCRLFNVKTIVVERGDLILYPHVSAVMKISMSLTYRLATAVWYKELYMKPLLMKMGVKKMFLLHNAVDALPELEQESERTIDFLWVNRLVKERKSKWFVDNLSLDEFAQTKNAMLGFFYDKIADPSIAQNQKYVSERKKENLDVYGYIDPEPFYRQAKYFVLPADIVYVNHSLIEAMSYGVVPIVSDALGADKIVTHKQSGFIFENSSSGFLEAMKEATALNVTEFKKMSSEAVEQIREKFSPNAWEDNYMKLIGDL